MLYNTVDPQLNKWYFNTRATHYTYKNHKLFKNFREYRIKVNFVTGITYTIKYGDVNIVISLL